MDNLKKGNDRFLFSLTLPKNHSNLFPHLFGTFNPHIFTCIIRLSKVSLNPR